MILAYRVVVADTIAKLEEAVRLFVEQRWVPTGGISVDACVFTTEAGSITTEPRYLQAMMLPGGAMIARALLLAAIAATAPALESWGVPDFSQTDKQSHALAGLAVGALATVALERVAPRWKPWQRVVAATVVAAAVGVAKEVYDAHKPGRDPDPKDALATTAGGAVGGIGVELIWRF